MQWVAMHIDDLNLIKFLRKMAVMGLTPDGVIVIVDNIAAPKYY